MVALESILRLPRWLLFTLWIISQFPLPFPRVIRDGNGYVSVGPIYATTIIFLYCFVIWTAALHACSRMRTPQSSRLQDRSFVYAAELGLAVTMSVISHAAYVWPDRPPAAVLVGFTVALLLSVVGLLATTWFAAKALERFEVATGAQRERKRGNAFLQLLFFPLGIWFLHDRIQTMLNQPEVRQEDAA